jgi:hypothetical protein
MHWVARFIFRAAYAWRDGMDKPRNRRSAESARAWHEYHDLPHTAWRYDKWDSSSNVVTNHSRQFFDGSSPIGIRNVHFTGCRFASNHFIGDIAQRRCLHG